MLVSEDDLYLISNVFNEILHGFKVVNFDNRIGVSPDEARALYAKVKSCIGLFKDLNK